MAETYIPKDLDDCFKTLIKLFTPENLERVKNNPVENMNCYHHGTGRWLRNEWGLWEDSRLAKWFNEKGIHHADDMSGIIFTSFWRELNSEPIKLDEQIQYYQDFWEAQNGDKT
jgi:hypothetical protein